MAEDYDWTTGPDGRANTSAAFVRLSHEVGKILQGVRLAEHPDRVAALILAQLAHVHGVGPLEPLILRLKGKHSDSVDAVQRHYSEKLRDAEAVQRDLRREIDRLVAELAKARGNA